jgi:hypothetical protein
MINQFFLFKHAYHFYNQIFYCSEQYSIIILIKQYSTIILTKKFDD